MQYAVPSGGIATVMAGKSIDNDDAHRFFPSSIRGPSVKRTHAHQARKGSLEGCSASASSRTHLPERCAFVSGIRCAGARQQPPNSVEANALQRAAELPPPPALLYPARAAARSARGARRERCCARLRTRSCASCPHRPGANSEMCNCQPGTSLLECARAFR